MGASILAYVVLDGYDLGVGMLMPAAASAEQDHMVASIGPFWTRTRPGWCSASACCWSPSRGARRGARALYLPVAAMLVCLMLRGVGFEMRIKAKAGNRELWNWLFWAGSFLASFAQGFMLGRYNHRLRAGLRLLAVSRCWPAARSAAATCCSARPG